MDLNERWDKLKKSLTAEVAKESILTFLFSVFCGGIAIYNSALVARSLTKAEFGYYHFYFTIMGLGIIFALSGYNQGLNKAMHHRVYGFIRLALRNSMLVCGLSTLLLYLGLQIYHHSYRPLEADAFLTWQFGILSLPMLVFDRIDAIMYGLNAFRELRIWRVFAIIVNITFVGGVAYLTKDLYAVLMGIVCWRLIIFIVGWLVIRRVLKRIAVEDSTYDLKKLNRESIQVSVLHSYDEGVSHLHSMILMSIGPEVYAIYKTGVNATMKSKDYLRMILSVPLQYWLRQGDKEYLKQSKYVFPTILGIVLIFCGILSLSSMWYIPAIYGEKYVDSIPVAMIISFCLVGKLMGPLIQEFEFIHRDAVVYQKIQYALSALDVAILFVLIYFFQEIGAAIAIVLGGWINLGAFWYRVLGHQKNLFGEGPIDTPDATKGLRS